LKENGREKTELELIRGEVKESGIWMEKYSKFGKKFVFTAWRWLR
jgi:hypothetical protein